MKLSLIILFISIGQFVYSQTYSSTIDDSIVLSFMKWEIKYGERFPEESKLRLNRKVSIRTLKFDTLNFVQLEHGKRSRWDDNIYLLNRNNRVDSTFTKDDLELFYNQFLNLNDSIWVHKIKGAKIKQRQNTLNQYYYSVPLFIEYGKYVLIKKEFYCGNVCAYGGIYLYRQIEKGKWELIKIFNGWIS